MLDLDGKKVSELPRAVREKTRAAIAHEQLFKDKVSQLRNHAYADM